MKRFTEALADHISLFPLPTEPTEFVVRYDFAHPDLLSTMPNDVLKRMWCFWWMFQVQTSHTMHSNAFAMASQKLYKLFSEVKSKCAIDRWGRMEILLFNEFRWEHQEEDLGMGPLMVRAKQWSLCFLPTLVIINFPTEVFQSPYGGTHSFVDPGRAIMRGVSLDNEHEDDERLTTGLVYVRNHSCNYNGRSCPYKGKQGARKYYTQPGYVAPESLCLLISVKKEWIVMNTPEFVFWSCTETLENP